MSVCSSCLRNTDVTDTSCDEGHRLCKRCRDGLKTEKPCNLCYFQILRLDPSAAGLTRGFTVLRADGHQHRIEQTIKPLKVPCNVRKGVIYKHSVWSTMRTLKLAFYVDPTRQEVEAIGRETIQTMSEALQVDVLWNNR